MVWLWRQRVLWSAVGGDQPGFADRHGLGAGDAQAGSFKIRPGLLRAVRAGGVDVEPVRLGEGLRGGGFDLGGKAGKNGEGGSDKRSNSDGRKSLDHDGPLSFGPSRPVSLRYLIQSARFGMSSRIWKTVSSSRSF